MENIKRIRILTMVAFVIVVMALPARADLIAIDGWTAGDGRITRDTSTGLDWLDLTTLTGFSVTDFYTDFTGLRANGFDVATDVQVRTLFVNAGAIVNPLGQSADFNYQPEQFLPGVELQRLLGCTLCQAMHRDPMAEPYNDVFDGSSIGRLRNTQGHSFGFGLGFTSIRSVGTGIAGIEADNNPANTRQSDWGIFLVRSTPTEDAYLTGPAVPVPEPSSLLLLGIGLAGIFALNSRYRVSSSLGLRL